MADAIHIMQCALSRDGLHLLPGGGGVIDNNVATHVAYEPSRPDWPLYVCRRHGDALADDGWSTAPAEPQSIELTIFEPLGTRTEHVLICGPEQPPGGTETPPSDPTTSPGRDTPGQPTTKE